MYPAFIVDGDWSTSGSHDIELEKRAYESQEVLDFATAFARQEIAKVRQEMESRTAVLSNELQRLEKQITQYNFNVSKLPDPFDRRTDYTKIHCAEEDGLEAGYDGWPMKDEDRVFKKRS